MLWQEAVEYIENNESRVRQDVQKIYGEDFRVWQWLPEMAWSPHDPYSGPPSPSSPSSPSSPPPAASNPWPHVPTTHAMSPGTKYFSVLMLNIFLFQVSGHVSQPLFTYDTLRQRDPYTRLDSDASSMGQSLSPAHQVKCQIFFGECQMFFRTSYLFHVVL